MALSNASKKPWICILVTSPLTLTNLGTEILLSLQNKSFQQMQPNIYLYCICYFSPYMFRALTGPSSGVPWAACLCHHLAHAVLLSVRASADGGLVVRQGHRPRTSPVDHHLITDRQVIKFNDDDDNGDYTKFGISNIPTCTPLLYKHLKMNFHAPTAQSKSLTPFSAIICAYVASNIIIWYLEHMLFTTVDHGHALKVKFNSCEQVADWKSFYFSQNECLMLYSTSHIVMKTLTQIHILVQYVPWLFLIDCILQTILHLDESEYEEKQYNVHIHITSASDAVPFSWMQYG
jgi:hypothetical protein